MPQPEAAGNQSRAPWGMRAISPLIKPVEDRVYGERRVFPVTLPTTMPELYDTMCSNW